MRILYSSIVIDTILDYNDINIEANFSFTESLIYQSLNFQESRDTIMFTYASIFSMKRPAFSYNSEFPFP